MVRGLRIAVVCLSPCLVAIGCSSMAKSELDAANEEFRLWCGDQACAWDVDEGEVEKVPTWHRKVYGIGLVSDPTQISQVIEMENVNCLLISLLADVDDDTTLHWEVDFYNDGMDTSDHSVAVDLSSWKTEHREVSVPEGCTEARIILRKTGAGSAVVAKADISGNAYCAAGSGPVGPERADSDCGPDGGPCEE